MKNKIAKAGLCVFAAGLLFTGTVYGAELAREYDDNASAITSYGTAFWRKRDKSTVPETETPEASPSPSTTPTGTPKDAPKAKPGESPQASPVAVPKETPRAAPPKAPKETGEKENDIETGLVRYYQPNSGQNQGQQGQPQNRQNQPNQQYQQNQQKQNINDNQGQGQGQGQGQRSSNYMPGIGEEIQRILDSQPNIQLDPNAYIVQHEDGLWLVMGNIRAKLDILIYVDQKNMNSAEYNHGNAIPLYK
jgi:hypothetical protein